MAPLLDSRGKIRYFLGAQVDVSGILEECSELEAIQRLLRKVEHPDEIRDEDGCEGEQKGKKDEFRELAEMFNNSELESVTRYGGRMHYELKEDTHSRLQARIPLKNSSDESGKHLLQHLQGAHNNGKLAGVYSHVGSTLLRSPPRFEMKFLLVDGWR